MIITRFNSFEAFIYFTNLIGVVAFSISGFYKSEKYQLDLFGAIILGVITSVGGGITRDILLNRQPIAFKNHSDIFISIITVILIWAYYQMKNIEIIKFNKYKNKMIKFVLISDAIGLSIFTITGSNIALQNTNSTINIIILATITSVMGGVYRDLLVSEIPYILKQDIYAVLCILGSFLYVILLKLHINNILTTLIVFFVVLIIRFLVIFYKLKLPIIKNEDFK